VRVNVKNVSEITYFVLHPGHQKIRYFGDILPSQSSRHKPNITKANIHLEHKNTTTQNKHKKLKPGLVSYNLWPGNEAGPILQLLVPTRGHTSIYHANRGWSHWSFTM